MKNTPLQRLIMILAIALSPALAWNKASAQCKPMIKIDNKAAVVNPNDDFGLRFPFWLNEGQTLSVGSSVSSISVIEFTEAGAALEYSGVLNITSLSPVSVPSGKVWKIESVAIDNNSSSYKTAKFSSGGTYTWTVPACAEQICIEIWGAGGGGSGAAYNGGSYPSGAGGGGGGFGSGCFTVVPGSSYTINVGAGGIGGAGTSSTGGSAQNGSSGGASNVGSLISATGGTAALYSPPGGIPGTGGTSAAASHAVGADGLAGIGAGPGGAGGAGGNGGAGGASASGAGQNGTGPGGGASGGGNYYSAGGNGAPGLVIISW
ncbi:MAG: hypothetical protein IT223_00835 [Crocinitomicaceae bacterium]|nr:hypothetical protein [Crocinitomicaceae bacterium]